MSSRTCLPAIALATEGPGIQIQKKVYYDYTLNSRFRGDDNQARMKERQKQILNAVVREYQKTGQPVPSAILIERYEFNFSPATVRAEMLELDEAGFLEQPHISAGRVPTDKALRFFVEEFEELDLRQNEKEQIWQRMEDLHRESIREMAQFLAEATRNLGISARFGRVNDFHEAGLKWLTEEPEFEEDDFKCILNSVDSLEENFNKFFRDTDEEIRVFIGRENPIKNLRNCSLMIAGFVNRDGRGLLGILGPKRMNYQKNKFVLEETRKKLRNTK